MEILTSSFWIIIHEANSKYSMRIKCLFCYFYCNFFYITFYQIYHSYIFKIFESKLFLHVFFLFSLLKLVFKIITSFCLKLTFLIEKACFSKIKKKRKKVLIKYFLFFSSLIQINNFFNHRPIHQGHYFSPTCVVSWFNWWYRMVILGLKTQMIHAINY